MGEFSTFECLAVVVKGVVPTMLLIVYHPPKLRKGFIDEFAELVSKISKDIFGDFNIHINTEQFLNVLDTFKFTWHVTGPTH